MSDQHSAVPRLSLRLVIPSWIAFSVGVGFVVTSLALQLDGRGSEASECSLLWASRLAAVYPWVLTATFLLAAMFTFAAANCFEKRFTTIKQIVSDELTKWESTQSQATETGRRLVVRLYSGNKPRDAGELEVVAKDEYLPAPYHGLNDCPLVWSIPGYLDLLAQEASSAQASAGKLAAALGGVFATGILTFGLLVEFLNQ